MIALLTLIVVIAIRTCLSLYSRYIWLVIALVALSLSVRVLLVVRRLLRSLTSVASGLPVIIKIILKLSYKYIRAYKMVKWAIQCSRTFYRFSREQGWDSIVHLLRVIITCCCWFDQFCCCCRESCRWFQFIVGLVYEKVKSQFKN